MASIRPWSTWGVAQDRFHRFSLRLRLNHKNVATTYTTVHYYRRNVPRIYILFAPAGGNQKMYIFLNMLIHKFIAGVLQYILFGADGKGVSRGKLSE